MLVFGAPRVRLNLALQGGGAHGAFTWGVLDALLEDGRFELAAVSGASAGAMNAALLAHGLLAGGREGARAALARFWADIGTQIPFEWITLGQGEHVSLAPGGRALLQIAQWLAPAQFNPLGIDPLRGVLARHVDFDTLRRADALPLLISATHARSGRRRIFANAELSAEVLLASACLPTLHHTVHIDGEPYWDGGLSANPALVPLVQTPRAARDTLLVLLLPLEHSREVPASAAGIRERMLDLAFGGPLVRELDQLAELTALAAGRWNLPASAGWRLARARWHLIDAQPVLARLGKETRLIAHPSLLAHLRDAGQAQARAWLDSAGPMVGRTSTVRVADLAPAPV